jgi:hypothetical protein
MKCGAIQDVLEVCGALSAEDNAKAKAVLDRIAARLTRLGRRGYVVREESAGYAARRIDTDSDSDPDTEGEETLPNKTLQPTRAAGPNGQRERAGSGPRG